MNPEEQAAFESVQAEKKELGIVDEAEEKEESTESKEDEKSEEDGEISKKEEVDEEDDSDEDKSDKKDKSEDDSEDDDEESDDDEEARHPRKQVSIREFKDYKKTLKAELQADFDAKYEKLVQESKKPDSDGKKSNVLETDIEALAKELNFDKEKTRKIIEVARKGLELSPEDRAMLDEFKDSREYIKQKKDQDFRRDQEAIFNGEWGALQKTLKEQYPNASDEQISKAKAEMDKLSHEEKYHKLDLGEILAAKKQSFDKVLFSPKKATFESGRPHAHEDDSDEDLSATPEKISKMTPAQFDAFEKRREAAFEDGGREKMRITTTDDRGRTVERYE